jgi:TPR repeat protein
MADIGDERETPPKQKTGAETPVSLFRRLYHYIVGSLSFATILTVAVVIISLFDTGHRVSIGSVPKSLEENGYSGGLIGAMLASDIQRAEAAPTSRRFKDSISSGVAEGISSELDPTAIKLPGTETTVDGLVSYLRKELGFPRQDYEVFIGKSGAGYKYIVQNHQGAIIFQSNFKDSDEGITCGVYQSALAITRDVHPYKYAVFAWSADHDQAAATEAVEMDLYAKDPNDSAWAHLLLGGMYRYHHDNQSALSEFQAGLAQARSNPSLQTDLALELTASGSAADRDRVEALLLEAAKSGLPAGQRALGNFYWLRSGSRNNAESRDYLAKAEHWLNEAASQNDASAIRKLASLKLASVKTAKTPEEARKDFKAALAAYERAASLEDASAQFLLSQLLLATRPVDVTDSQGSGEGGIVGEKDDMSEGMYWLRRAAENGDWRADFRLGEFYEAFAPETGDLAIRYSQNAASYYRKMLENVPDDGSIIGNDSDILDLDEIQFPELVAKTVDFYIVSGDQAPRQDVDFPGLNLKQARDQANLKIPALDGKAKAPANAQPAGPLPNGPPAMDTTACALPPPPLRSR